MLKAENKFAEQKIKKAIKISIRKSEKCFCIVRDTRSKI